jgi:chromosome segregation ATPase
MSKSNSIVEQQLDQYKNDIVNTNQSNEQEMKIMKLKIIDYGVNDDKLNQLIVELKSDVKKVQSQFRGKTSMCNNLKQELNSTKNNLNQQVQTLSIKLEQYKNDIDYAQCQNNDLCMQIEQSESKTSLLEDEKQQLANKANSLENEISDLSIQINTLTEENQTLQETYEWNLNELTNTQEKLTSVQLECDERQRVANDLNEELKSVTDLAYQEQKDFQGKYYECTEMLKKEQVLNSKLGALHDNAKHTLENYKAKVQDMNHQSNRQKSDIEKLESDNKDLVEKCLNYEDSMTFFQQMAEKFKEESTKFSTLLSQEKDLNQSMRFQHESIMKQAQNKIYETGNIRFLTYNFRAKTE